MVILNTVRSRTDKLLTTALRLAEKAIAERASANDLEELAAVVIELDEAIVIDREATPARWRGRAAAR